ncbi:MAG TPA: alpha/beta hydrolase fold domain-containing protein [Geminicoccus sp.]|uniref:alpha/beta hydrolase fold domain-containing protein n=1 Tax=Geminicoccus sp. TaxID=2024832 RepID=UPI002E2FFBAE|nr:alpha/beta hydrolase fold domain-containing protein [Geminicoccus sp.]HEX2528980.1 alpha/beta hydrolase fold domain-containing protein [Geminicoccus sp.]
MPPARAGFIQQLDIVYDVVTERDSDGELRTETLKLDLYRPRLTSGPAPLLVYIHGGCYVRGSKSRIPTFLKNLANSGIAVASVDYRLAPDPLNPQATAHQKWLFPAALKDVQQALRFLRRNKDRFLIDPARVAAHGESAGGYLATVLGVMPVTDREGMSDGYSDRVTAVSDWYGRSDFTLPASPAGEPCHEYWLGTALTAETKPVFQKASLLPYVNASSVRYVQIMHGSRDPQVDIVHSVLLNEKLRAAGIKPDFYLNEGWRHGFSGSLLAEAVTRNFLLRRLGRPHPEESVLWSLQINAGRTDTRDPDALPAFYQVDQYMDLAAPGTPILYQGCVDHPTLPRLYWDARYGKKFGYRFPVANGVYRIRLHFAECRYTRIGQRRQTVGLFGIPMLRNHDTLRSTGGGFATPDLQELNVIVRNGRIDLGFATANGANASINALEIERLL